MGVEIERKFLVNEEKWQKVKPKSGTRILQGYIMSTPETVVRIRVRGDKGLITIKGKTQGISRLEYEYSIPKVEAEEMLNEFCPKKIIKVRYELNIDGFVWEIDEFESPKTGLILAEIELTNENEVFTHPEWLDKEVSNLPEYYNVNMI